MNQKLGLLIGTLALIIAVVACFFPAQVENVVEKTIEKVGAVPFDIQHDLNVHGKLNSGGDYTDASTTMTSALTLTAAQVCNSSVISVNSAAAAGTLSAASLDITLPATSTLWTTCLKTPGDKTEFEIINLSPTAASTTQIVAGTGMDLFEPAEANVFNVEIAGGNRAHIKLYRPVTAFESNLDVVGYVTEYSPAD